jgi:uncharacterized protein YndB with AHSA1/START domain
MSNRIEKKVQLNAPIGQVWQALTDSHEFGKWFGVKLEQPFTAGQACNGHLTVPGYEHLTMTMMVTALQPQTYFAYTWHPYAVDSQVDYSQEPPTLVEFKLTELGNTTELIISETGFAELPAARREEAFAMNERGWNQQITNLQKYLTGV